VRGGSRESDKTPTLSAGWAVSAATIYQATMRTLHQSTPTTHAAGTASVAVAAAAAGSVVFCTGLTQRRLCCTD